jgi:hypothetical protein
VDAFAFPSAVERLLARLRGKIGNGPAYEAIASREPAAPLLRNLCFLHTQHPGVLATTLDAWLNVTGGNPRLSDLGAQVTRDLEFERERLKASKPPWRPRVFKHGPRPQNFRR